MKELEEKIKQVALAVMNSYTKSYAPGDSPLVINERAEAVSLHVIEELAKDAYHRGLDRALECVDDILGCDYLPHEMAEIIEVNRKIRAAIAEARAGIEGERG